MQEFLDILMCVEMFIVCAVLVSPFFALLLLLAMVHGDRKKQNGEHD